MHARIAAGLAAVLFVTGCKNGPTTPSGSYLGKPPVALRLTAPSEIEPGQSAQLVATVVRSDGSTADATRDVRWTLRSTPTDTVIVLTDGGVAMARDRGQAVLTAHLGPFTADATILVIPRGTFRLAGRVTEQGAGLGGVRVAVLAGTGSGLATTTNLGGEYELYGVSGSIHLRASKDGYLDRAAEVEAAGHRTLDIELSPFLSSAEYGGLYTLIVTGASCRGAFPEHGKQRLYTAQVEQQGTHLRVVLSGANFRGEAAFSGLIYPGGDVTFIMRPESPWDEFPIDVWEILGDGMDLVVHGVIPAERTAAGISRKATAADWAWLWVTSRFMTWCDIDRFEMVPR